MPLLPDSVVGLTRVLHIAAAVIWLGGLWFSTWLERRVYPTMKSDSLAEFAPNLARSFVPWLSAGAALTLLLGMLVYIDQGQRIGFESFAWSLNLGALFAFVAAVIQFAFVVPHHVAVAKGNLPDPVHRKQASARALIVSVLSFLTLVLMIGATRIGGPFR